MFNVELSVVGHDGHAVVALCGELDLADAPAVASHLIAAVAACGPSIIVDLAGLDFIDCCGMGCWYGCSNGHAKTVATCPWPPRRSASAGYSVSPD